MSGPKPVEPADRRSSGVNRGTRGSLCFPSAAHLRKHAAFDLVYKEGRRMFSENMTVFVRRRGVEAEPGQSGPRVGFTVSRAMGGAVERNRIKRRLREAVRLHLSCCRAPVDLVINPKRNAIRADFVQLAGEVERAFAGIQQREGKSAGDRSAERRGRQGKREG